MPRRTPALTSLLALLPLLSALAPPALAAGAATLRDEPATDLCQIDWQRSLEDALALALAEGRPILVAVNMDGESASERIVREDYRDPDFVAATRRYVCVVSSVFRHAARDHDDEGRRIPCPRLGQVTCGEHVALEPLCYDRWLGGERIAPRHALILPDGTKAFDLFQLWDLAAIRRALVAHEQGAPPPADRTPADELGALVTARDHASRLALEQRLSALEDAELAAGALTAIAAGGDAGSLEALRALLAASAGHPAAFLDRWCETARARGLEAGAAVLARERLQSPGPFPGAAGLGLDARLLRVLAELDGRSAATRSLLLAHRAAGAEADAAEAALAVERAFSPSERSAIDAALAGPRPAIDFAALIDPVAPPGGGEPPPKPVLRPVEQLERELEEVDRALRERPGDPALAERYGRASLEMAQQRIEAGGSGAELFLEDAARWLEAASAARRDDVLLLLERARTAFLRQQFELQERLAREALELAGRDPRALPARIEALRWLGDAAGRLLAQRSGADPAVEAAGIARALAALGEVAASALAGEDDWRSLISVHGALGMRREELAAAQAGAARLPASGALRQALHDALWIGGRIDLAPAKAEWILSREPGDAASAWWAGFAHVLAAEQARRAEDPQQAIASYRAAEAHFAESAAREPGFRESADHYRALAGLGRGFAHLLADQRVEAARALAEGIAARPAVASARDGLDREALDLVDGVLEWRASGPSPVPAQELLAMLERADPVNPAWARAVSDSELREALRFDGRSTRTRRREVVVDGRAATVDAPLPAEEGDPYMEASIAAARRALELDGSPESRRALAQAATVHAERLLERGEAAGAGRLLAEAAPLLERDGPPEGAGLETLREVAARLRAELGEARPVARPGR